MYSAYSRLQRCGQYTTTIKLFEASIVERGQIRAVSTSGLGCGQSVVYCAIMRARCAVPYFSSVMNTLLSGWNIIDDLL
jgi:hypothetical protein